MFRTRNIRSGRLAGSLAAAAVATLAALGLGDDRIRRRTRNL